MIREIIRIFRSKKEVVIGGVKFIVIEYIVIGKIRVFGNFRSIEERL